jgi:hypothetical protein
MKKIVNPIILLGIGFAAGFTVAKLGNSNPLSIIPNPVAAFKGEDSYEIKFEGNPGDKLFATYSIGTTPARIEKIEDRLPYTVKFTAPRKASVSAHGFSFGSQAVKVTILRNGIDCHVVVAVGSAVSDSSKICY